MSQTTSWTAIPIHACTTCKKRKRACDKQIPKCSSCKWLETPCQYERYSSASRPRKEGGTPQSAATLPWLRTEQNSISSTIQDYATNLFVTPQQLDAILYEYFSRVHHWMPFIARHRFYSRLSTLSSMSDTGLVLVICAMHLVLTIPPHIEIGSTRSAHYMEVKRLLALAESQGTPGMDIVQCRILVALYEINHGATDEAYLSLGTCSRAGIILGLDNLQERNDKSTHLLSSRSEEEERRTWWAIIILDRLLRLQRPHWPTAVKDPSSSDLLPMEDADWTTPVQGNISSILSQPAPQLDSNGGDYRTPMPLSTGSHIRVGYFARLAQVSHLLGRAMNNKFNPTPDSTFNEEEAQQLRRTVAVYAELLPKEATAIDCSHYCGPYAICQSAQLILEQPGLGTTTGNDFFRTCNDRTKTLCASVIPWVEELNIEIAEANFELLRPLALPAIFQVALIYVRQYRLEPDLERKHSLDVLLRALSLFEQRWRIAGVYRDAIVTALEKAPRV